jgi:hypothetical protein
VVFGISVPAFAQEVIVPPATPPPAPPPPPAPAPAPPPAPVEPQIGYDGGLFLRTSDKRYSLYVNGFAQLLYTLQSTPTNRFTNNFDLGLGRLALSGNIFSTKLFYFFQFEGSTFGNNNLISMLDWWMKYSFSKYFYILAGRHILPYSRQFYTHPGNLLFADLSPADYAFNLPRAIGVQVGGVVGRLAWDLFVNNSIRPLGVGTQVNRGDSIAAGGRLELAILKPYGYLETNPTADSPPELSVGAAAAYNPVADASTFQNVQSGDNTVNLTADLGFRWRRLSVQGAWYWRRKLNNELGDNYGYYAQVGFYVIRNRFELAIRASGVDFAGPLPTPAVPTAAAVEPVGASGDVSEYSAGFNLYLFGHGAKLQADYTYLRNSPFGGTPFNANRARVQLQVLF